MFVISGFNFKFIQTRFGGKMLMFDGYTYSRRFPTMNYYCSKKDRGCKAKVKLNAMDEIVSDIKLCVHDHEPPKYRISSSGIYVKISS